MSCLTVYHQSNPDVPSKLLTHAEDIVATLAEVGVAFEHWSTDVSLAPGLSQEEVISALGAQLDALMSARGHSRVAVLSLSKTRTYQDEPDVDGPEALRSVEAETHVLVAGRGLFNLHAGEHVYAVLCERGDMLSIPAGACYWLDSGEFPHLIALCMGGRVAEPTGDAVASHFPRLDY